ncbi:DUF2768 domain-containing protein [Paenibacillus sp. J5C_2022]|uniref:DUF2768 domain-containing protein n=1 Tax=Paenibacillus sp. J5C2022 TaxID=2977129 RepID=UPI0021D347C2|nr:DUF2768 domain-containing protein [Paenibacillus sp. J5C2022]MCU6710024.1 DUF2768 domain-containing protein [Paenibacillus sp. J5C2022]
MDPMTKMWVSFLGIGLMAIAAVVITFARLKTKGFVRIILSIVAFFCLLLGFIYGFFSII